ncbi:MAG: glycosyltransferase family 2 protein [Lachnospiraceae bacterium]
MVSVIIPAFNTSEYLEEAIHSVMSLKGVETELIVVDDGSTDDTPERLKKMQSIYPAMRVFSQENQGAPAARNRGIREAKGEYLLFLDSDDRLYENGLARLVQILEENEADLALGSFTKGMDEYPTTGMLYAAPGIYERDPVFAEALTLESPFPATKLYRADRLRENQIFFENLRLGQDLYFYLKYLYHSKRVVVSGEKIAFHRIRKGSISNSFDMRILDIISVFQKLEEKTDSSYLRELTVCRLVHYDTQMRKYPYFAKKKEREEIISVIARATEGIIREDVPQKWMFLWEKFQKRQRYRFFYAGIPYCLLFRLKHAIKGDSIK